MIVAVVTGSVRQGVADSPEYAKDEKRMEEIVTSMPGFISYEDFSTVDGKFVFVAEFESEEALKGWKNHPEHLIVQRKGREIYFESYHVVIAEKIREYDFKRSEEKVDDDG